MASSFSILPPFAINKVPYISPFVAVFNVNLLIEAIDGRASPLKPKVLVLFLDHYQSLEFFSVLILQFLL